MSKPQKMVYEWGKHAYAVAPQIVGDTIERIARKEGYCPPARLVEVASSEESPLHPIFTWDNELAATHWRTHEARRVINCLVITVQLDDGEAKVPAFLSVGHTLKTQGAGEGYRSISMIKEDPDFSAEALNEVISRLRAMQQRYAAIEELLPVWQALDQIAAA